MTFNATFNNISVLLVQETGVSIENHRPVASHWQNLSHTVVSSTPRLSGTRTHNVSGDRHLLHNFLILTYSQYLASILFIIYDIHIIPFISPRSWYQPKSRGAWGMDFASSSLFSLLPPFFQNFHINHSFFKIFVIIRFSPFDNISRRHTSWIIRVFCVHSSRLNWIEVFAFPMINYRTFCNLYSIFFFNSIFYFRLMHLMNTHRN